MADYHNTFRPSYYVRNFKHPLERCQNLPKNFYPHNDPAFAPYVDPRFYSAAYHRSRMPHHHGHSERGCGFANMRDVSGWPHRVYAPDCPGCTTPFRRIHFG